jgi:hypothetical protein
MEKMARHGLGMFLTSTPNVIVQFQIQVALCEEKLEGVIKFEDPVWRR